MKKYSVICALLLAACMLFSACGGQTSSDPTEAPQISEDLTNELSGLSDDVIDADLTCTITLGNWPPDTATAAELALFEGYKATMEKQYPNVTLVPDYYSYSLSTMFRWQRAAPRRAFSSRLLQIRSF